MEKPTETTPLKELNQLETKNPEQKTPPQEEKSGLKKKLGSLTGTPDRLMVPKAFKYPERYMSPTDRMISPVSKGLILARSRIRPGSLLPPSIHQSSKIRDLRCEDVEKGSANDGGVPGLSS